MSTMNYPIWLLMVMVMVMVRSGLCNDGLLWSKMGRALGTAINECWRTTKSTSTTMTVPTPPLFCLRRRARTALRKALSADVIPLGEGLELVRYQTTNDTQTGLGRSDENNSTSYSSSSSSSEWSSLALDTVADVFESHAIRVSVHDITTTSEQARRRRKNHMFPLMMFGVFGLGMILIPMGFKFLAVLGGKALLLAKMALLLSSIQGLKKVATSGIGYGLYHAPATSPWYDRKAEDMEASYRLEDGYINQYPEQIVDYKRYPQ